MATTVFPNSNHQPPVGPYTALDPHSFAFKSVTKRWPTILTQIIDHLFIQNNLLLDQISTLHQSASHHHHPLNLKLTQGKSIITQISELKYEAGRDKELKPLEFTQDYDQDEKQIIHLYNQELSKSTAAGKPSWFSASWLLTECYLYQKLHGFFRQQSLWKDFDPFEHQKRSTFQSSWDAVVLLCSSLDKFLSSENQSLQVQFNELLNACLWGNATDLSLLPNMTHEEIQVLQKTSSAHKADYVLRNDSSRVWESLVSKNTEGYARIHCKRIDFVLDNAGFELFTDLVLADWIVSNSDSKIIFHPKLIPWFVSDVMRKDIDQLLDSMIEPNKFFEPSLPATTSGDGIFNIAQVQVVQKTGIKWKNYFDTGRWKILDSHLLTFWTNPLPFWDIPSRDERLLHELQSSDLVIFKGDLNYRKLTGDAKWPTETSIEEAVGPLNGLFNILSLRTCKADVCVGLEAGQEARLDEMDADWRVNGKFGLISFVSKTV